MRRRTAAPCAAASSPSTRTVPAVGRSSVAHTRSSVVLPAPLGPNSATAAPRSTVQVEIVEGERAAEALAQVLDLERGGHAAPL